MTNPDRNATPKPPPADGLSPAAWAALQAYEEGSCQVTPGRYIPSRRRGLAAALRALAAHQTAPWNPQLGPMDHWRPDSHTRRELQNIAAEIEAARP